ncbi:bifunctional PIG-L family deacetylase/class I SAM-dependent methyltransferase [Nocardioides sp.]|uniref:bifunctional PIG-L family deacetylase/class I SAM-dependent methyltransferase n=1 Tax=Nocardioides sp. TaxID=35761 RepID=UPI002D0CDE32|nr:bifunctional PIG-L family deacetylase/class I SAM-dependent methyltransferase [Nocardioides sp.]HXH77167.1 bifunctional PIG-L family deacetylase/class I SAM-dependent methyltransferase [Nocardioides sp.]
MTDVEFSHDGPGTPVRTWDVALAERPLAILELPPTPGLLVVLGAHPDDESLGVAGLINTLSRRGWQIAVISATAGEGSHPSSPTLTREELGDRRRDELDRAIEAVAPAADVTCLGLPDGEVAEHEDELVRHLVAVVGDRGAQTVLCAPWRKDGHPDHEAAGRAAAIAARRTGARLLEYPVWLWHWGSAPDLPWQVARAWHLDDEARTAKRSAIAAHTSQVLPISDRPGDEVLLVPQMLAHFTRGSEVVVEDPSPISDAALDEVHRSRPDPWQVDSWYERRKRALTVASLPREHYSRALEIGCSIGALAEDLAARCDQLLAVDSSPAAVAAAGARLAALPNVEVRLTVMPDGWPEGLFDLVSVSEVGYFLSPRELDELIRRAFDSLAPGGHIVLCHWRHQPVGWPLDGPVVHDAFRARAATELVALEEPDFLLHVLGGPS